jgi:hypothetical protein
LSRRQRTEHEKRYVTNSTTNADEGIRQKRIARWWLNRRAIFWLSMLAALLVLHPLILRLLARPLQAADSSASSAFLCLHGSELGIDGFKAFDRAVEWQRETVGTVLLLLPRATRLVEIGAVPSFEQTCRRELAKRGVPENNVELIHADARNTWDEARALSDWLNRHPQATVSLACSPFAGGRMTYVFNKVLDPSARSRVRVIPLPDPASTAKGWWRSQSGVKDLMYAWLDLAYAWWMGDDAPAAQPSAAEFRKTVTAAIGEAPR